MKLSWMNGLSVLLVAAAILGLSGCDAQARRAKESVDQKLKPMGIKKTDLGLFVVDPAAPNRAYISVTATWNFADASGQPQKEYLGFGLKRDGDGWQVDQTGIKYTEDKNKAIEILNGRTSKNPSG
jgi:hypothetical protein